MSSKYNLIVGSFNTHQLFLLTLDLSSENDPSLTIVDRFPATGFHSWLALSKDQSRLYATAWENPQTIVSYKVDKFGRNIEKINSVEVSARSGYVAATENIVYSVDNRLLLTHLHLVLFSMGILLIVFVQLFTVHLLKKK